MGLLRYIIQGVGWEIGRSAAREGIEAAERHVAQADARPQAAPVDRKEARRREREQQKIAKRQAAELERQLADLKKRAGR